MKRSITKRFIDLFAKGVSKQPWCFRHGAFVLAHGREVFGLLRADGRAYERISSHRRRFASDRHSNQTQYGYDFGRPMVFRCDGARASVKYRTLLFFELPNDRIYVKFEPYGTKKLSDTVLHLADFVRTRYEVPRGSFRKEKMPKFSRSPFPNDWDADEEAEEYHSDRVGREVFLGKAALTRVIVDGLAPDSPPPAGRLKGRSPTARSSTSNGSASSSLHASPGHRRRDRQPGSLSAGVRRAA